MLRRRGAPSSVWPTTGPLSVALTARIVAMLVVWVVVMWMEWRRVVEEERQFA